MPRYFLELSYKGTNYSGFQVQKNAKTIQGEVEAALNVLYKEKFDLTGSSRTDAGVHALQNFFHFDSGRIIHSKDIYNLNAILPADIAVSSIYNVADDAHCRFGALSREYKYFIYNQKDPFLKDRAWYYPFKIDETLLHQASELVHFHSSFIAFSKQNTQVNNFDCNILMSKWVYENNCLIYNVQANRFLRGMVRALVSSMLRVARGTCTLHEFEMLLHSSQQATASFAAPAHGLFLTQVVYPLNILKRVD